MRENPTQDLSALSRDTENALNELGRIFDKETIAEQQELAAAFGEEAFRLAHNLPDDGSGRKVVIHAIIGGIMSQITVAGFASGAIGAGVNEAVIGEIKKIKDPGTAQIVSAIVGAAAAKAIGGNAGAGASAAASGTKNNLLTKAQFLEKERRLRAATTESEREAIEQEYRKLDKEKDRQDNEEEERLTKEGILSPDEIADIINKKNTDYVTFDGLQRIRLGRISVTPADAQSPALDFLEGVGISLDNNVFFGLRRNIFPMIAGRPPHDPHTLFSQSGKIFTDEVSIGLGLAISFVGGGITLGSIPVADTGIGTVITPEIASTGLAVIGYGGLVIHRAVDNSVQDIKSFQATGKNVSVVGKNRLSNKENILKHIFSKDKGHLEDTPQNREKLIDVANKKENLLGRDQYGNEWYAEINEEGKQYWVELRNGEIWDGGLNEIPKNWNEQVGLKRKSK